MSESLKLLIGKAELDTAISRMAARLKEDYPGPLTCLCVLKGALYFFSDLTRLMGDQVTIGTLATKSYDGTRSTGFKADLSSCPDLKDRDVLVIEDIVDTGHSMTRLLPLLQEQQPRSLRVCVLIDKKARREVDYTPDYSCFTFDDPFVVGYGFDYDERYRNLPEIYELSFT